MVPQRLHAYKTRSIRGKHEEVHVFQSLRRLKTCRALMISGSWGKGEYRPLTPNRRTGRLVLTLAWGAYGEFGFVRMFHFQGKEFDLASLSCLPNLFVSCSVLVVAAVCMYTCQLLMVLSSWCSVRLFVGFMWWCGVESVLRWVCYWLKHFLLASVVSLRFLLRAGDRDW